MPGIGSEGNPVSSNVESEHEDEYIHLLEERRLGKLIFIQRYMNYVLFPYGFILMVILAYGIYALLYISDGKQWPKRVGQFLAWFTLPVCTLLLHLIGPYVRFFRLYEAHVPVLVLICLLKEVEIQSSRNSKIKWREIAYHANEFAWEIEGTGEVFYSGDHCMNYFNNHIVGTVMDGSYEVATTAIGRTFGDKKSHRDLLNRSVQSYQRIAEAAHTV